MSSRMARAPGSSSRAALLAVLCALVGTTPSGYAQVPEAEVQPNRVNGVAARKKGFKVRLYLFRR